MVTVPTGVGAQLVQNPAFGWPIRHQVADRGHLGHCPALGQRQPHRLGLPRPSLIPQVGTPHARILNEATKPIFQSLSRRRIGSINAFIFLVRDPDDFVVCLRATLRSFDHSFGQVFGSAAILDHNRIDRPSWIGSAPRTRAQNRAAAASAGRYRALFGIGCRAAAETRTGPSTPRKPSPPRWPRRCGSVRPSPGVGCVMPGPCVSGYPRSGVFKAGDIDFRMFATIVYRTDLITDDEVLAAVDKQLAAMSPRWPSMTRGRLAAQIDKIVAGLTRMRSAAQAAPGRPQGLDRRSRRGWRLQLGRQHVQCRRARFRQAIGLRSRPRCVSRPA